MFQNLKVDVIYYKTNSDFEMEFNLCGCCRMRLLSDKTPDKKTMIMSLWKVPDIPTSILMDYFYQNLFKGMEVRPSLIEAQKQLQKEGYTDPFYWASFIVID